MKNIIVKYTDGICLEKKEIDKNIGNRKSKRLFFFLNPIIKNIKDISENIKA